MAEARVESSADGLRGAAAAGAAAATARRPERLQSLDAMRGLTVAAMIVVNNPGSWTDGYAGLAHSSWHGWTLADLVFPFFLLIVGVSLELSLAGRDLTTGRAVGGVARARAPRAPPRRPRSRLERVSRLRPSRLAPRLRRLAADRPLLVPCGCVVLATGVRGPVATIVVLLAGYWPLLDGRAGAGARRRACSPRGQSRRLSRRRAGSRGHLYRDGFDPEGLLSTLPAVATTLLGVLAGRWLRAPRRPARRSLGLVAAGIGLALAGQIARRVVPHQQAALDEHVRAPDRRPRLRAARALLRARRPPRLAARRDALRHARRQRARDLSALEPGRAPPRALPGRRRATPASRCASSSSSTSSRRGPAPKTARSASRSPICWCG